MNSWMTAWRSSRIQLQVMCSDYFEENGMDTAGLTKEELFGAGGDVCTSGWKVSDRRGLGERWKI